MIKRYISILMAVVILFGSLAIMPPLEVHAADYYTDLYIKPQDFTSLGTWTMDSYGGAFAGKNLHSGSGSLADKKPATINLEIPVAGKYYIWARTRDFATQQGTRFFKIEMNNELINYEFGKHGVDGWAWENGGGINLPQGSITLKLIALSNYARTDGVFITNDPHFVPANDYTAFQTELQSKREIPTNTTVRVDGKVLALSQPAVIMDGVVMIPMKPVYEEYGAVVNWDASTSAATAVRGSTTVTVRAGDSAAKVNGTNIALDHAAVMAGNELMVPGSLISKAFGAISEWYEISKTFIISTPMREKLIYLRPESFDSIGTWSVDGYDGAFGGLNLRGLMPMNDEPPKPENAVPAVATITGRPAGQYRLWARTKDFSTDQGTRFFQIRINNQLLSHVFGKHGINGWKWEDAGIIELTEDKTTLELVDTSGFWPRVDGVLLSSDLSFTPPNNYEGMLKVATVENSLGNLAEFPAWAKSEAASQKEYTIENGNIRVTFYEVPADSGRTVIQKQTFVRYNNSWVETDNRHDEFGYLLMYAKTSQKAGSTSQFPFWMNTFDIDGKNRTIVTGDIFKSGLPSWLIPSSIEKVDDRTVKLSAESDLAKLTVTWSLPEDGKDPKVQCKLEAKQQGSYSLGMFNGGEKAADQVDFVLDPFRINSKRLPQEPYLVTESYSSAALSLMTLSTSTSPAAGTQATYSVAVDPSSIPNRWANDENSRFGLGILGKNKGVQPSIFAPLFGTQESVLNQGQTYEFTYRPVTRIGGWYDSYSHIVKDIFGLRDYRQNYYSSLTQATFNMQKLLMDDKHAGWDPVVKAHYNMEGRNISTQSDLLVQIQSYLLTEDKDIYERRTLPTLEFMLTRGKPHFTATGPGSHGGGMNLGVDYSPLTGPINAFGTSVYGGAYVMTRGQTPILSKIGIDGGPRIGNRDGWASIPAFSEYVWEYNFTGRQEYLEEAKRLADLYLKDVVYAPQTQMTQDLSFVAVSFYPYFSALLDLYEACGEQKYLDGAAEGARLLMSTIWTQPLPPNSDITIDADTVREIGLKRVGAHLFWQGDVQKRTGVPENLDRIQDETVPAWLPSRVGLGLEQTSTFRAGNFSNIIMANWAPDFIRLAKYTDDELFETYARNAVIGRYANYPGYYFNQFMTYPMKEDYPYNGPDITSIYYQHMPILLGLGQDFLITQAWKWSDGKINFPAVRQQGYVWFNNRHYGFESGDFFDEKDMWLWLKEGLITVDNMQIDWVGARKDGVFAAALMNEDTGDITTTVHLGDEVTGGSYNGTATVYRATGEKTAVTVVNGELTVTIPAHGLVGIKVDSPKVTAPAFSKVDYEDVRSMSYGDTIAEPESQSDFGKGTVLQIDPGSYYAYVYITQTPETVQKAVLHYRAGGEWQQQENSTYPFEFTVKVEDVNALFEYYVEILDVQNSWSRSTTKTLGTINNPLKLRDLTVNGQTVEGFMNSRETYNIELPYGTTAVPVVTAAADDPTVTVEISAADSIPGSTTITLRTAQGQTKAYRINFMTASPLVLLDSRYQDSQGNTLTGLVPGGTLRSSITIRNTGSEASPVALMVVLYDAKNAVENVALIEGQLDAGETEILTGGFGLPQDVTGYRVKTFLWDSFSGQKSVRDAIELR